MSAAEAARAEPRHEAALSPLMPAVADRWARGGAGEPPVVALVKQHLNSVVVVGVLLFAVALHGRRPDGLVMALAIVAYAVSLRLMTQPRLDRVEGPMDWGRIFRHRSIEWLCVSALLGAAASLVRATGLVSQPVMATWFVATPFALTGAHVAARRFTAQLMRRAGARRRQVIVGANRTGCELAERLAGEPWLGAVAGFFDDRRVERLPRKCRARVLGRFADLPEYACRHPVQVIYICLPISAHPRIRGLLDVLGDTTASIYFVPDLSAFDLMQARFGQVGGMPLFAVRETPFCGMDGVLKRASDLAFGAAALALAAPAMLAIAFLVRRSSRGPVLFKQRRYGLDGREFMVWKFRTMTAWEDDIVHQATRGDPRVTRVGRFLRRTSLDELPQLFNVIAGSMSLVGPRPHAVSHNEHYRKLVSGYMLRHKVRPGITGLAQVNGLRGETASVEKMHQRVQFDLEYLKHWSLGLDIRILLKTARLLVTDRSAY
jgi:putative colanic acid biosynthesis UDP-glucose lipid carrier transferase